MLLKLLSGPLLGAVIGYFTNLLAVKMLFYPHHAIYLWGHRLPLTPGAIPKGQARLAQSVGEVVTKNLLTEQDIEQQLLSPSLVNDISDRGIALFRQQLQQDGALLTGSAEEYNTLKEKVVSGLSNEILNAIQEIDPGEVVATEGKRLIREKTSGSLVRLFVSDKQIEELSGTMNTEVTRYIAENGLSLIRTALNSRVQSLEQKTLLELLEAQSLSEEQLRQRIIALYQTAVHQSVSGLLQRVQLAKVIEDKINAFDVKELQALVEQVMKKELNMITNLGALVGFALGLFNLLF